MSISTVLFLPVGASFEGCGETTVSDLKSTLQNWKVNSYLPEKVVLSEGHDCMAKLFHYYTSISQENLSPIVCMAVVYNIYV